MEAHGPKYPGVRVRLSKGDGNAFSILARVSRALKLAGASRNERRRFRREAMAGDYQLLLRVCMRWVEVT